MSQIFHKSISFNESAFYSKRSSAFKPVHLPPSLKKCQVSKSYWHLPIPWKILVWYITMNNKGEFPEKFDKTGADCKNGETQVFPMIFHVKPDLHFWESWRCSKFPENSCFTFFQHWARGSSGIKLIILSQVNQRFLVAVQRGQSHTHRHKRERGTQVTTRGKG